MTAQATLPDQPIAPAPAPPASPPSPVSAWLDPRTLRLFIAPRGWLCAMIQERVCYLRVGARRLRPLTDPSHLVSLWANDLEEVGVLENPADLDAGSGRLLDQELRRRYFMPIISRVIRVQNRGEVHTWEVETDHGRRSFFVQSLHQNIRRVPPERLVINDVRGNRYDIPDLRRLDSRSVALIQRHL